MLYTILLIILILWLVGGGIGTTPFHYFGTGYYGGGLGLVLVIIVILLLLGRI